MTSFSPAKSRVWGTTRHACATLVAWTMIRKDSSIFLYSPQVAWVRIDTQTILTIHHNIITRNQRVSLSHHDREIWRLHLERVQESDRGWYMCQVNTDPMRSQRGFLEVVGKGEVSERRWLRVH